MSNSLCLEKKDLQNIIISLQVAESQVREQHLQTTYAGHQMGVDISSLAEYYSKRLALIERNKKNIQWLIDKISEVKEETLGGDVVAQISIIDRST